MDTTQCYYSCNLTLLELDQEFCRDRGRGRGMLDDSLQEAVCRNVELGIRHSNACSISQWWFLVCTRSLSNQTQEGYGIRRERMIMMDCHDRKITCSCLPFSFEAHTSVLSAVPSRGHSVHMMSAGKVEQVSSSIVVRKSVLHRRKECHPSGLGTWYLVVVTMSPTHTLPLHLRRFDLILDNWSQPRGFRTQRRY